MDIKDVIRNKRKEKGYTLEYVGNQVGVTRMSVHRWERGDSYPTIGNLKKLEEVLDVKILSYSGECK